MKRINRTFRNGILFISTLLFFLFSLVIFLHVKRLTEKNIREEAMKSLSPICSEAVEPYIYGDYYRIEQILFKLHKILAGYIVINNNGKIVLERFTSEKIKKLIKNKINFQDSIKLIHLKEGYDVVSCSLKSKNEDELIGQIIIVRKCDLGRRIHSNLFNLKFVMGLLGIFFLFTGTVLVLLKNLLSEVTNINETIKKHSGNKKYIIKNLRDKIPQIVEMMDNLERSLKLVSSHYKELEKELKEQEIKIRHKKDELMRLEDELLIEKGKTSYEAKMSLISKAIVDIVEELKPTIIKISDETEEWLTGGKISEDEKKKLFLVYKSINRITELLSQMEGVVKTVTFTKVELNLSELVIEIINEITKPEGYEIEFEIEDNVFVMGSYSRLREVFIELIKNARDALEKSKQKKIKIRLKKRKNLAIVTIEDTGPGFKEIAKVFDPFYTEKVSPFHKGLGLTIAKKIILEHEGEIIVSNKRGGGARVEIYLPSK